MLGLAGVVGMAFVLYKNLVPFPGWPSNLDVAVFLGATAAICTTFVVLRGRHSPVLDSIGTTVEEAGDTA